MTCRQLGNDTTYDTEKKNPTSHDVANTSAVLGRRVGKTRRHVVKTNCGRHVKRRHFQLSSHGDQSIDVSSAAQGALSSSPSGVYPHQNIEYPFTKYHFDEHIFWGIDAIKQHRIFNGMMLEHK